MSSKKIDVSHLDGNERLLLLADILEKQVDPKHFDMGQWASSDRLTPASLSTNNHRCGSAACALGTAAVFFKGLIIRDTNVHTVEKSPINGQPYENFEAGEMFFDLTPTEADIFSPWHYGNVSDGDITPKRVAREIRKLVAKKKKAKKS